MDDRMPPDLATAPLGTVERRGDLADLRYERRYDRPPEMVWAALTVPERIADWIGKAYVEPRLGGRFELFIDRKQPTKGVITVWQPPLLLEYTWQSGEDPATTVRWELTAEGGGTRLVFTHNGLRYPWIGLVLPGWHAHLRWLGIAAAGMRKEFDMAEWRALQQLYLERYKLEGVMTEIPTSCQE
jgi:uncharacterized protein YndB with AHSA1/START domain